MDVKPAERGPFRDVGSLRGEVDVVCVRPSSITDYTTGRSSNRIAADGRMEQNGHTSRARTGVRDTRF
jgi:hypothetical protein